MSVGKELLIKELEQEAEALTYAGKQLIKKAQVIPVAAPVIDRLASLGLETEYVYLDEDAVRLYYYSVKSLKPFVDGLEGLESLGFPLEGWKTERAGRETTYVHPGEGIRVKLVASMSDELCEQVQVGEETKTYPIYEYRCRDDEPVIQQSPQPAEVL